MVRKHEQQDMEWGRSQLILGTGIFARVCLFALNWAPTFQRRVEISTPLNSWLSVEEGLYLMKKGITPYLGDTFHESPLALVVMDHMVQLPPFLLFSIFIFCDLITAFILAKAVQISREIYLVRSQKNSKHTRNSPELIIKSSAKYGEIVLMCYLLNPFTIVSCVGQTTTVFANLITAIAVFSMLIGDRLGFAITLSLAVYQSLYPITLLFPAAICIYNNEVREAKLAPPRKGRRLPNVVVSALKTVAVFMLTFTILLYMSFFITNDWTYLDRTYGFILNVRDLKPNIGLFWYFFTEMFEHFHLLFICTFQINAFIYVIPLTIRFYKEPPLLIYSFCALMTIFKSYPSVGDVGFYLSLLPMWKHLFPFMQQKFLVGCFFIATSVLAPIQWFLWIYSGSANANFYFGVTIAFGTAQIFLLTDVLLAYLKREHYLEHGFVTDLNGKPKGLTLM